ncbi:MAG: hypothetical protein AB1610_11130 [Nitrospirota bacterium]
MLLFLFSANAFPAGKEQPLPKEYVQKLRKIANFFADELEKREIKTITVKDFTNIYGKPSVMGKKMARELSRQLKSIGNKNFRVIKAGGDAVITGILVPFTETKNWKLDIKIVSADRSMVIMSYTGIFKKPDIVKKEKNQK